MKIRIKIDDVEISIEEMQIPTDYPRIVSNDKFNSNQTKSARLIEVVHELMIEAIKAHKSKNQTNEQSTT